MAPPSSSRLLSRALTAFGIVFLALPVLNRYWPSAWAWQPEQMTYLHMIWSIYATLGVFLLLAARDPARHLSLIWFTVWSSLAHGTVMAIHAVTDPGQIGKLTGDVPGLFVTAVVLTLLTRRLSREAMPI
jgi:uncharacterized protein DUF6632